jgi:hypothetical protein
MKWLDHLVKMLWPIWHLQLLERIDEVIFCGEIFFLQQKNIRPDVLQGWGFPSTLSFVVPILARLHRQWGC